MKIDGSKIKAAREAIGMSPSELAAIAGYTPQNIANIEHGRSKTMNTHIVKAIAKALKVNVRDIAEG